RLIPRLVGGFSVLVAITACGAAAGVEIGAAPTTTRIPDAEQQSDALQASAIAASSTALRQDPTTTTSPATTTTMAPTTTTTRVPTTTLSLEFVERITGDITPKSVVYSGDGLFFAQNMMYRHTITVYDRDFSLVSTLPDSIDPSAFGLDGDGVLQGAPVEAAFTSDGRYGYISNYQMFGPGYSNAGGDECNLAAWDESFVYRIDTSTLTIDQVIPVGAVPKFIAVTPDDSNVLVTNWCTFDLSLIDAATGQETTRVALGRHPRGIAVASDSTAAYVAVMGSRDIAIVSLTDLSVGWLEDVGANPRHLVLSPDNRHLYATLNGEGRLAKIDLETGEVVASVASGSAPRSMAISDDGDSLYVVNYGSNTISKVLTADFSVAQTIDVDERPIGITFDPVDRTVWVANYSGSIMVFAEQP
ncbi:MAG: YncE family protein, partial [Acidimicrobiia bacterium]|nr:YncE family protein [Acidimicrobiia bacterium]